MKLKQDNKNIILQKVQDFNIGQILECGQCFNFYKKEDNEYIICAKNKLLRVIQKDENVVLYNTTMTEYDNIWRNYFDLDRDYSDIKKKIIAVDSNLEKVVEEMNGVRIINQDFFETLISFIISQNKQIPHIKQIVKTISKRYGQSLGEFDGEEYYSFPDVNRLSEVSIDELRECKTGFRAPYIFDACQKVKSQTVSEEKLRNLEVVEARELLMTIKGVGEKVANCVLLFGIGRREVFPVDVWMKRIMETLYLGKETKKEDIEKWANNKYGELGGYAQQYLFYYGRENGIGKK